VLGELLVDLELAPSAPVASGCGSCRSCLDACPTGAFVDAYTLDARRCISYLTIELRGPIPRELRPAIGRWVFGCDICQEVCPFNQSSRPRPYEPALGAQAIASAPDLIELLELTSSGYRRLVKKRALGRANRVTLQRNAAVALGNARAESAVPALTEALRSNPSALVREHVAWALGQIGTEEARRALAAAFEQETEPSVIAEIALASAELQ
jgi:epoxyqueuosine reductase